jgi:hypothetical protein
VREMGAAHLFATCTSQCIRSTLACVPMHTCAPFLVQNLDNRWRWNMFVVKNVTNTRRLKMIVVSKINQQMALKHDRIVKNLTNRWRWNIIVVQNLTNKWRWNMTVVQNLTNRWRWNRSVVQNLTNRCCWALEIYLTISKFVPFVCFYYECMNSKQPPPEQNAWAWNSKQQNYCFPTPAAKNT